MTKITCITRFAPSPTGLLHLGNARTALLNALAAHQSGGRFLLRIEDTDEARGSRELEHRLLDDLAWLGVHWDEGPDVGGANGPYRQSERHASYQAALAQLERQGLVYPCFCTQAELALARRTQLAAGQAPRYPGTCRELSAAAQSERHSRGVPAALRFRVPSGRTVTFTDRVHGEQRFASDDIGDFVIRRADGSMAFFFANAVDDAQMGVNLVLRGADHLANTPRQLLLLEALDLTAPQYGHMSLLLGADGAPLSKRHGAASLHEFRQRGFLPEALRNHLVRLGHTVERDDWLSDEQMLEQFAIERLGRAPARFDEGQLMHWQKLAVAHASAERVAEWLRPAVARWIPSDRLGTFVELVRGNIVLPPDAADWAQRLAAGGPPLDEDARVEIEQTGAAFFVAAGAALTGVGADLKPLVRALSGATGRRGPELYRPLRAALTGTLSGPELAPTLAWLGPTEAARRIETARAAAS